MAAAAKRGTQEMFGEISMVGFFLASPTMIVLAVCSVVTVGFALERVFYFASTGKDSRIFMGELAALVQAGDPKGALELCRKHDKPVARVLAEGVRHINREREEIQQHMDTAIDLEVVEMERNLGVLGTMSNIAPLLGLFGTVVGIIRAFADIARTGSGGGAVVAMGVSEALMTTAAGIVVAVIATVAFNAFVRVIRTRTADLERAREDFFMVWHRHRKLRQPTRIQSARQASDRTEEPVVTCIEETLNEILS
jgi:biopolymer transport protein ExbB